MRLGFSLVTSVSLNPILLFTTQAETSLQEIQRLKAFIAEKEQYLVAIQSDIKVRSAITILTVGIVV